MKVKYESLIRKRKFYNALRIMVLSLIVAIVVLAPTLWLWGQSIEMRSALRSAKNVLLNIELLSIQYNGTGEPLLDNSRASGMSEKAEAEVRSFSGADGEVRLTSWNGAQARVLSMSYQEEHFLLIYNYSESEDSGTWTIYWKVRQYNTK